MTSVYELSWEELEEMRDDFERRYAKHVKSWCGMQDSVQEIAARLKEDRNGRHYKNEATDNAWNGYCVGAIHPRTSTPDFLERLNRDQLARCVELANQKLEALRAVEKVKLWQVIVDEVVRFASKTPDEALDWLARFTSAFAAAPKPDLIDSRKALSIETFRVYADEVDEWLAGNDKPEDFAKW